jgi:serine/threonine protein kinase
MPEEQMIAGRYRLLAPLGSGGEARVYRAHDSREAREVALRLPLKPVVAPASTERPEFHPGWVRLLADGIDPVRGCYQVFELLEGETLSEKIRRGPLEKDAWLSFVRQSLDAVEALHGAGWVHGDLNAENFLERRGCWKLLELPFLRLGLPSERSGLFGGLHTLSPEQLEGRVPDFRSDLYALGCLYYYAAAGAYPHPGATRQEVAISVLRFSPASLEEKAPALSAAWARWTMNLLGRDRPPSVTAARRLLEIAA